MIELKYVQKKYGKNLCLKDINIEIKKGGLYVFSGTNGSGKTTVLNIICRVIYKSSGELLTEPYISYLPDHFSLPKLIKVKEYLKLLAKMYRRKENVNDWLKQYQIPNKRIGQLSKGNYQKLGILQILKNPVDCFVLDEPLDGLDEFAKHILKEEVAKLLKEEKMVILSLHNRTLFQEFKPTIFDMKEGNCFEKRKKV